MVNITTQMCETEFFFCATPSITGSGSGVVLREDGLIITNSHVVSGAQNIRVVLSDGRRLDARITASDPNDDLAVIKVDPGDKPLKAIALGDSDKPESRRKGPGRRKSFRIGADPYLGRCQHDRPDHQG